MISYLPIARTPLSKMGDQLKHFSHLLLGTLGYIISVCFSASSSVENGPSCFFLSKSFSSSQPFFMDDARAIFGGSVGGVYSNG